MTKKLAIILDGAHDGESTTEAIGDVLRAELDAAGVEHRTIHLRDLRIAHCQGEFDCWLETPGLCRAHDAGHDLIQDMHDADLVVNLCPITYGGYSPNLKKGIDRVACLLEPFLEKRGGRVHHVTRYQHNPAFLGIGWVDTPAPDETRIFPALVEANAINLDAPRQRALVFHPGAPGIAEAIRAELAAVLEPGKDPEPSEKELQSMRFRLLDLTRADRTQSAPPPIRHVSFLIGSARPHGTSTSESLSRGLLQRLEPRGISADLHYVTNFVHDGLPALDTTRKLLQSDLVVLAAPLYADSFPYLVTRAFAAIAAERRRLPEGAPVPAFMLIVNCGFAEAAQNTLAVAIARIFARSVGLRWAGALALGGGQAVNGVPVDQLGVRGKSIVAALDLAAESIASAGVVSPEASAMMTNGLPPWLYMRAAHWGWRRQIKEHGLSSSEVHARPLDEPRQKD